MSKIKLDLHGFNHPDAKREVIRFIEKHWATGEEVEIITGHSHRMRGVVENILEEYDLDYSIGYMHEHNSPRMITWLE